MSCCDFLCGPASPETRASRCNNQHYRSCRLGDGGTRYYTVAAAGGLTEMSAPLIVLLLEAAVQHDRDRSFVFVQKEPGVFEARTIKLGDKNGTLAEVLEGVQEGEAVVREGAFTLKSELLKPKD